MQAPDSAALYSGGRKVIVRAFGGRPLIRRVLSITSEAAFVCRPEMYDAIARGDHAAPMSGFPIGDVFEFNETVFGGLTVAERVGSAEGSPLWDDLEPVVEGR